MGFYADHVLPHLIQAVMRGRDFVPYRQRVVSRAAGRVLEIGLGAGENLPFYGPGVRELVGLEPAPLLARKARAAAQRLAMAVEITEASAESMPLDARSFDTVVMTWTLCSVADPLAALREIRRVLRPDGRLLFVEHGASPEAGVRRWQDRITPIWKQVAGGCHLNRPMNALIESGGFTLERLDTGYMPGFKPVGFTYEGLARPAEGSSHPAS